MAKISFLVLVLALVAFLRFAEAHQNDGPAVDLDVEVLEQDLLQAKNFIGKDLQEKEKSIKTLETEVDILNKSEKMLNELGKAYKSGKSLEPFGKKLKKFNRKIKETKEVKYVSIIQSILKDLGLNGGRY